MEEVNPALTLVLALAAGVLSQTVARHLRLPGIVVLLIAGVALGPDGLDWVNPRDLGSGFFAIVDLAVAIILFEGGLNLQISRLRREQAAIRRLVLLGALATLGGAALAASLILGWDWKLAVIFGSLVVVTGPTVVGPLVSELRLRTRISTVLNAEGVLIDPVGAILAVLVLELVLAPEHAVTGATELLLRVGSGAALGFIGGFALSRLLRIRRLVPEGHENIFVLASVLLIFQLSEQLSSHSGILAVTLAGVTVGNTKTLVDRDLREFKDQLTVMLIGLLFVMLAADVRFDEVASLGWPGISVVAALVFIVRPLVVAMSTVGSELTWRERLFVGWMAPRGIVAAAVASLVAGAMEESGLPGGNVLRALVFLTIAGTVLQAGLTARFVARWLGVQLPARDGIAILGAGGLGLLLAEALRKGGTPVVFLDSNPQNCRQAEEAGFPVIFGNALEERILQRARLESFVATVGLTPNQTVNAMFVRRAREFFGVPGGYISVEALESGIAAEMVRNHEADVAFDGVHDVERWDVRLRHGGVEVAVFRYPEKAAAEKDAPEPPPVEEPTGISALEVVEKAEAPAKPEVEAPRELPPIGERLVMLALLRKGKPVRPISRRYEPVAGDRVEIALHIPDLDEALAALTARGWVREEPEPEPEADGEPEAEPAAAGAGKAAAATSTA